MQLTMRIVAKVLFSVEVKEDAQKVAAALNLLMRHTSGCRMIMPPPLRHLPAAGADSGEARGARVG